MLTASIINSLQPSPDGKTLIITVGSTLRSDDGVGPYIARHITSPVKNVIILNAEEKPENILGKLTEFKPIKTIIIDAANFGGIAGEIRLLNESEISNYTLSTHTFPLGIIAELIKKETGSSVFFLGIQRLHAGFGEKLSKEVKKSADSIIKFLNNGISHA